MGWNSVREDMSDASESCGVSFFVGWWIFGIGVVAGERRVWCLLLLVSLFEVMAGMTVLKNCCTADGIDVVSAAFCRNRVSASVSCSWIRTRFSFSVGCGSGVLSVLFRFLSISVVVVVVIRVGGICGTGSL